MITLNLKSGGSVAIATVPEGTTLQSLISSQVTASGREVRAMYICTCSSLDLFIMY